MEEINKKIKITKNSPASEIKYYTFIPIVDCYITI